jgi:hypothetical protein
LRRLFDLVRNNIIIRAEGALSGKMIIFIAMRVAA